MKHNFLKLFQKTNKSSVKYFSLVIEMLAVNVINLLLILTNGVFVVLGSLALDSAEMRVLDSSFGNCEIKILPTKPKSIDLDVHAFSDAKDVLVRFKNINFFLSMKLCERKGKRKPKINCFKGSF